MTMMTKTTFQDRLQAGGFATTDPSQFEPEHRRLTTGEGTAMTGPILLVDAGNTAVKWVWLTEHTEPVHRYQRDLDACVSAMTAGREIDQATAWLSSVGDTSFCHELAQVLASAGVACVHEVASPASELGVSNSYADPSRLGVDRWLAMLGAKVGQAEAYLIVDAGTALTMDLVAADGRHEGGYIVPGPRLMQSSLLTDTQRVRFSEGVEPTLVGGCSTADCVSAGIWTSLVGAIEHVMSVHPDHKALITGGDAETLLGLGVDAQWRPHLVLEGLALKALQNP